MTPAEELARARVVRNIRAALNVILIATAAVVLGFVVVALANRNQERKIEQAKADQLDHYCALMRITAESVIEDIAHPLPEIARDPKAKRRVADVAVGMWNTLATIDHRALTPCLRPPIVFGDAYIAPEIFPCPDGDAACALHNASAALANFEPK